MQIISIRLPSWMIDMIDRLVEKGIFVCRAEFIRWCIRAGLKEWDKELNNNITDEQAINARLRWRLNYDKE